MRIALRRGAMLGLPTLGAALGALVAGTALSSQKPPAPANFTTEDLRLCVAATAYATVDTKGSTKARYSAIFERFHAVTPNEDNLTIGYRSRMLKTNLSFDQVRKLADACQRALDKGKPFANPFPAKTNEAEFQRFLRDGDGRDHMEAFSDYDGKHCKTALAYGVAISSGDAVKRYLDAFSAMTGYFSENLELFGARTRMFKAQLDEAEVIRVAEACRISIKTGTPFINPLGTKAHETAYYAWLRANPVKTAPAQASAPSSSSGQSTYSPPDPLIGRCDATLERTRAAATKDFRLAQQGVQTYLKTGVRIGFDYIQYGCLEIDSGINELRGMSCPAEYANALQRFRNGYYIGLPSGSTLQCN